MNDDTQIKINHQLTIPHHELSFRFSTSGGPGGQHANRSATRAILEFSVATSPSLNEHTRPRLLQKLANRIDKEGVLQIQVQESRSQHQNRQLAIERFRQLLADALKRPKKRRPTKPSRAAKERRLQQKRLRSQRKKDRGKKWE